MSKEIYLDTAASAPILPQVKNKLLSILDIYANPSSLHDAGINAAKLVQESKDIISEKFNCSSEELYFTSGATMSNNQSIIGFLKRHPSCNIITSSIEHDDIYLILENVPYSKKHKIPCDSNGIFDLESLKELLDELEKKEETSLVSVQWANNEMGIIQDMKTISDLVNSYSDAYLHTDATQYIPWFCPDIHKLKIDMLSSSAQKVGGIKGTGLLYVREGVKLSPIIYGDQGLIGGTENVPGISCFGEAIKNINYSSERLHSIKSKRDYLYGGLSDRGILVGSLNNRLPNNLNMIFEGIRGEELQSLLSSFGVYVSTGSACSSHTDKPSKTLTSLGYTKEQSESSIRFSLGDDISYNDLNYVIQLVNMNVDNLRNK